MCWSMDGHKVAITSRDQNVRIFDVRTNAMESKTKSHENVRDSRVLFVSSDYMITTGGFVRQFLSVQCIGFTIFYCIQFILR